MNMGNFSNFTERTAKLRGEILSYIKDYMIKANRSIIVEKGNITYIQWDDAFFSTRPDEVQVVPEVEITMITLTPDKEVMFVDAKGNEVYPSSMDTEELTYVVDYLDYLDDSAPDQADNQ